MQSLPQAAWKPLEATGSHWKPLEAIPWLREKFGWLPVASSRLCARARGRDRDGWCVCVCVCVVKEPCFTEYLILPIPRHHTCRRYKMQTRVWNYPRARTSRHGTGRVKRSRGKGVAERRSRPITLALHSRPPARSFFRSAPSTCI
jgi:hypothetical protein